MKYAFLPHTSDVKFKAYGKSIEECFSNAAVALTDTITSVGSINEKKVKSLTVMGDDLKALLYNFLEELLFIFDTESFITHSVKSMQINRKGNGYMLSAALSGDTISDEHEIKTGVKAVTYMDMEVTENYVVVVLDI